MRPIRFLVILLFYIHGFYMKAQEVITPDTLAMPETILPENHDEPLLNAYPQNSLQPIVSDFRSSLPLTENTHSETPAIDSHAIATPITKPYLMQWSGGLLTGSNSSYSSPMMDGRAASVTGVQHWGDFSITGTANLTKDHMSGMGIQNGAGVGLQLDYQLNRNLSITGFAGYQQLGFLSSSPNSHSLYFGGFLTAMTNNGRWGVDVGMRRYYDSATGQWTNVPIVMPYYNLNGAKLGIDFGGLLLQSIQGLDKALNPGHYKPSPRGGGIIKPEVNTIQGFGPPELPYVK